jgi:hypothetical protein
MTGQGLHHTEAHDQGLQLRPSQHDHSPADVVHPAPKPKCSAVGDAQHPHTDGGVLGDGFHKTMGAVVVLAYALQNSGVLSREYRQPTCPKHLFE